MRCAPRSIWRRSPAPKWPRCSLPHPDGLAYAPADVSEVDTLDALVDGAAQRFGIVDLLFNNAAVFDMAPLLDADEAMYQRLFDVNVKGMFFVMQTVLARLVAAGRPAASSTWRRRPGGAARRWSSHYCASKAAVISYTQSAALAMAPHGIRVNAIAPGVIDTPMWAARRRPVRPLRGPAARREEGRRRQRGTAGPHGLPADIAGAAVFLASDEAAYITAQTLNVDGGNVMS